MILREWAVFINVLYESCDLEMTFDLYLWAQLQHKNELDVRKAPKDTYTKYELFWLNRR